MTLFQTITLLVGLYVLYELFAIPLMTSSVGWRVGIFRRVVVIVALVVLGVMSFMLLTGRA